MHAKQMSREIQQLKFHLVNELSHDALELLKGKWGKYKLG
jgi:hypothetical protein